MTTVSVLFEWSGSGVVEATVAVLVTVLAGGGVHGHVNDYSGLGARPEEGRGCR